MGQPQGALRSMQVIHPGLWWRVLALGFWLVLCVEAKVRLATGTCCAKRGSASPLRGGFAQSESDKIKQIQTLSLSLSASLEIPIVFTSNNRHLSDDWR